MSPPRDDPVPRYHRLASTTQKADVAELQERSGEVWGRTDRGTRPGYARWTGPRPGVIVDGEFAKIRVTVTLNTQR